MALCPQAPLTSGWVFHTSQTWHTHKWNKRVCVCVLVLSVGWGETVNLLHHLMWLRQNDPSPPWRRHPKVTPYYHPLFIALQSLWAGAGAMHLLLIVVNLCVSHWFGSHVNVMKLFHVFVWPTQLPGPCARKRPAPVGELSHTHEHTRKPHACVFVCSIESYPRPNRESTPSR